MGEILLTRHGKTAGNLEGRYIGSRTEAYGQSGKTKNNCWKKYRESEDIETFQFKKETG